MTPQERQERFATIVLQREKHTPFPWQKKANYVLRMKQAAADSVMARDNDDIVRNLLGVHQQQQDQVAAAENESRSLREQIDAAQRQIQGITQALQQTQGQLQQTQMQAQAQVQQAQMQAQAIQAQAGPAVQTAEGKAQQAEMAATQAKTEAAEAKQLVERIRQATMDYKGRVLEVVSQDPVTLAAAQDLQRQQQMASAAQAQNAQAQAQQAAAAEQQGQPAPGQPGQEQGQNPMDQIARMVAGQGERAGMRRAMADATLQQGAAQGAQQGQGGMQVPQGSLADAALKQGAALATLDKVANDLANDLRARQGGRTLPPDRSTSSTLLKLAAGGTPIPFSGR